MFLTKCSQYSDVEVITEVLAGNIQLFEILIRRYNPYLYKVGKSYGFYHHDVEDLMQEAFISAYMHLQQFAENASFKTWLIKIMLNHCYRKAGRPSYRKEETTDLLPDNSSLMFSPHPQSNPGNAVINKEFNKVVEACLRKLPEVYRTTFVLRELSGFSVAETAEIMQASNANIKVRLNRAKVMLRKEIEHTYSAEDIYEFNLIYCDRIVDGVMTKIKQLQAE